MLRAENYSEQRTEIGGVCVVIREHRIGSVFHCHIDNFDPGARITGATADSVKKARRIALARVEKKLGIAV